MLHVDPALHVTCRPRLCVNDEVNPLTAIFLIFTHLKLCRRDPQLQVSENYSDLTKWRSTLFKSCWLMSHFIFNIFKMWYFMC